MCNSDIFLEIEQPLRLTFTQFWPFIARMQEVFIDCTYFEPHKQCLVFIFCTFYRFSCFPIALDASIGECDQNSFYNFHWPKYVLSPFIISDYNEYIIKATRLSSKFTEKKQKSAESLIYCVWIVAQGPTSRGFWLRDLENWEWKVSQYQKNHLISCQLLTMPPFNQGPPSIG